MFGGGDMHTLPWQHRIKYEHEDTWSHLRRTEGFDIFATNEHLLPRHGRIPNLWHVVPAAFETGTKILPWQPEEELQVRVDAHWLSAVCVWWAVYPHTASIPFLFLETVKPSKMRIW